MRCYLLIRYNARSVPETFAWHLVRQAQKVGAVDLASFAWLGLDQVLILNAAQSRPVSPERWRVLRRVSEGVAGHQWVLSAAALTEGLEPILVLCLRDPSQARQLVVVKVSAR